MNVCVCVHGVCVCVWEGGGGGCGCGCGWVGGEGIFLSQFVVVHTDKVRCRRATVLLHLTTSASQENGYRVQCRKGCFHGEKYLILCLDNHPFLHRKEKSLR